MPEYAQDFLMSKLNEIIQLQSSNLRRPGPSPGRSGCRSVAISKYLLRAVRAAGITWELAQTQRPEAALERRIFPEDLGAYRRPVRAGRLRVDPRRAQASPPRDAAVAVGGIPRAARRAILPVQRVLRALPGVEEASSGRRMRQRHFAGEEVALVDYAGPTVPVYGMRGDEAFRAHIFVGAMGASGYAYAEATRSETLADWLGAHVRALTFYGASPAILVPDNPKVGVTKADRYEPELQRSYEELATHYNAVVIPARPYKPKDKSKAERRRYRWSSAGSWRSCATSGFFSLEEPERRDPAARIELNAQPFQKLPGTRRSACSRRSDHGRRCGRCRHAVRVCRVEARAGRVRLPRGR